MAKPVDVVEVLRSVLRIAKVASIGVNGNAPRIKAAEDSLDAVAELIAAVDDAYGEARDEAPCVPGCPSCRIQLALAACKPATGAEK